MDQGNHHVRVKSNLTNEENCHKASVINWKGNFQKCNRKEERQRRHCRHCHSSKVALIALLLFMSRFIGATRPTEVEQSEQ